MVVIETKSEITEYTGHEVITAQYGDGKIKETTNVHRLLMLDPKCFKLATDGYPITIFIHNGYMQLKAFLYPCTIEFSLMSLTVNNTLAFIHLIIVFFSSYSFLSGKILAKHLLIEYRIKHQQKIYFY